MSTKLLPCPHCGETEHLYPAYHGLGGGEPYAIDCLGCGADYTPRDGFDVIALWNRRTPDSAALQSRVKQLEETLRDLIPSYRNPSSLCWCEMSRNIEGIEHSPACVKARTLLNGGSNERD